MAKSTNAGGPSMTEEEASDPPIVFTRPELGVVDRPFVKEEESSPDQDGMDSSQSSQSDRSRTDNSKQHSRKPAQTMENLSGVQGKESDSTVHSTDGDGPKATQAQSSRRPSPRARVRNTDDLIDEFEI